MNKAATQDLRAVSTWPTIEQVLAGGPAPSKLAEEAANMVTQLDRRKAPACTASTSPTPRRRR